MSTSKDLPLHRGNPVQADKDAMAEAFHKAIDTNSGPHVGLPKQIQMANAKKLKAIMKSVRAKRS